MKDLLIEQRTNKIVVENHNWRFTKNLLEYTSQKIRHTISVFEGEWFMDRRIGIPYIPGEDIGRNMHRRMIETALQVRIGEIDGVERFLHFSSTLDKGTRQLRINFTVQIVNGEKISDSVVVGG